MNTRRYLMLFSYLGSGFRGSQRNEGFETVQNSIELGLKNILKLPGERPVRVFMSSRTDAGVHVLKTALMADLPSLKHGFMTPSKVMSKLNGYFLNYKHIRITSVHCVDSLLNISSLPIDKTYLYRVGLLKEEFFEPTSRFTLPISEIERTQFLMLKNNFDMRKAEEATVLFEGIKDFGAVVGRPTHNIRPTVCNIMSFKVEKAQPLVPWDPISQRFDYYNFVCKGNRFLFHMVRRMVTLTLSVGYGRIDLKSIKNLFDNPVPSSWPTQCISEVPGNGLYLIDTNIDIEKVKCSTVSED